VSSALHVDVIPLEFWSEPRWIVFKVEPPTKPGEKPKKVPYRVDLKHRAASTKPADWSSVEDAIGAVDRGLADGIGYALPEHEFTLLDLDDVTNGTGTMHPAAAAIIVALDTYTEWSHSGEGLHCLVRGRVPGGRRQTKATPWSGELAVWDHGRFVYLTGQLVPGPSTAIEERQAKLDEVCAEFLPERTPAAARPAQPIDVDDQELLERAFAARGGDELRVLYTGGWQGRYDSQSEADLALCSRLAFWFQRDPDRIDRVFRGSRLYRGKWERADYREDTIEKAIAGSADVYTPRAATSSLTSSRPRPGVTSSLVPHPSRGDEDEHLVPDLVPEQSTWVPVDIVAKAARPPEPPQIIGLLYPGLNHLVTGESEALKTWLMMIASTDELTAGRGVLWVDGDDVGSGALLERLRLLGADDGAIAERFAYVLPDEPLDASSRADVLEVVRSRGCRLAVFDGFNPLLLLHGLDPNKGTEIEVFYRLLDPIRKQDVAVVITDNVVKSSEARGAWAIGSERKKSKAEVHLGMKAIQPLVRGGVGRAKITVHKDRPGFLTRPSPGLLVVDASGDRCTWSFEEDTSRDDEGEFRPTELMERVSRFLEVRGTPASRNQIEEDVKGKGTYVRTAIDRLVVEGYAAEVEGPRKARLVRLERPFRKAEDEEVERLADRARADDEEQKP
jgi:NrS-1  polymerase HBD domain